MSQFVLRYKGEGAKPAQDVERVRSLPHTEVLDDTSPYMLLVDGPEAELAKLVAAMPGWFMSRVQAYKVSDPLPRPYPARYP